MACSSETRLSRHDIQICKAYTHIHAAIDTNLTAMIDYRAQNMQQTRYQSVPISLRNQHLDLTEIIQVCQLDNKEHAWRERREIKGGK